MRSLFNRHALKSLYCCIYAKWNPKKSRNHENISTYTGWSKSLKKLIYDMSVSYMKIKITLCSWSNLSTKFTLYLHYSIMICSIAFHSSNFNCIWLSLQFFNVLFFYFSRKNSLVVRTQLSVRVHAIIGK